MRYSGWNETLFTFFEKRLKEGIIYLQPLFNNGNKCSEGIASINKRAIINVLSLIIYRTKAL